MTTVKQVHIINATVNEVWKGLTDPEYITAWGGGPAIFDMNEGGEFTMWNNEIHGKNVNVNIDKKLVQEWYVGKWNKPSLLTFDLSEQDGKTRLEIHHTDVPPSDFKDIDYGWKEYFIGPMKKYLENK